VADSPESSYRKGVVDRTLVDYGAHLERINGSQERTAAALDVLVGKMNAIEMAVQGLRDEMASAQRTVVATADALAKAEEARRQADKQKRDASDHRWTPMARILAVIGSLVAIGGFVMLLVAALG